MPLVIDEEKCARCGSCEPECPHEAIYQTEDAYVINALLCTECVERYGEPFCVEVCSNEAPQKLRDGLIKKCLNLFG